MRQDFRFRCPGRPTDRAYSVDLVHHSARHNRPTKPTERNAAFVPTPCYIAGVKHDLQSIFDGPASDSEYTAVLYDGRNTTVRRACLFSVGYGVQLGLAGYFSSDLPDPAFLTGNANSIHGVATGSITYNPVWLEPLYTNGSGSSGSVNGAMASIAQAMTNQMHQDPGSVADALKNNPALGITYETTTCVRVAWPWLTAPIVLVVMSGFFLGLTIWKSKRGVRVGSGPHWWKSNILAVLYHGLSEDARLAVGAVPRVNDM